MAQNDPIEAALRDLAEASREAAQERRGWRIGLTCMGVGAYVARMMVGPEYGYNGDHARMGGADYTIMGLIAVCALVYWRVAKGISSRYYAQWEEITESVAKEPNVERYREREYAVSRQGGW
jgi:hypothetical protein